MRKILIVLGLFLIVLSISFAVPTIDELIEKIQSHVKDVDTFQANITTRIVSPLINEGVPSIQKSKVYKKGEDKMRTEIPTPDPQIIIYNGRQNIIKDLKTGKIVRTKGVENRTMINPFGYAENVQNYLKNYKVTINEQKESYQLLCIPKKKTKVIKRVEVYINKKTYGVEKLQVYDQKENKMLETTISYEIINECLTPITTVASIAGPLGKMIIRLEFTEVKINEEMPDSLFEM